ncbi:MAG: TonB family protein [Verrucomicrobiota bacterium]|jgi:TonB family protein
MNRLQKKCFMVTAGIHLLLLVILFVGPAFFSAQQKPDDLLVLDVIPANLIDAPFNSGVKNAQPPPPVVQPAPQPPVPISVVTPPTLVQRLEKIFTPEPVKPMQNATESEPHKIQVNTQLTTRTAQEKSMADSQRARAIKSALQRLKNNLSSVTEVNLSGNSSAAYANYGDVVLNVYHNAWMPPDGMASDNVTVQFKVTIARDGTVISARIVTPSGDANIDAAVQRMLDRVTFIAPFPESTTETERPYLIKFKATRTNE